MSKLSIAVNAEDHLQGEQSNLTTWSLDIANYQARSRHIRIVERVNA